MNYLKEMNAFIDWLETNPLEASAQTLWFHLMAIANKSGWPEWFTVANPLLQAKVGISENSIIKHRNMLVQKGRIEYKNQGKKQAGKYRIIPFAANIEVIREVNREVMSGVNREVEGSALFKLNETKPNNPSSGPNPFRLFETEGFGTISSFVADNLGALIDDYGERWVCEAMKAAVLQGKRKLSYVGGILKSWKADGIDEPWEQNAAPPAPPGWRNNTKRQPNLPESFRGESGYTRNEVPDEEIENLLAQIRTGTGGERR